MASTSSSISSSCKHDVFLSFRGEDTRKTFTSHLYAALRRKQIITFIDNGGLKQGDEISPSLLSAIEGSKISIIIFSKDYASSRWCLDELVKILDCQERNGQIVVPVFYHVDPSHMQKQEGTFRDVFVKHEENYKQMPEKVQNWRVALTKASNLAGWNSEKSGSEAQLVDQIVKDILEKLENITVPTNSKGLVGLDSRTKQIKSLLCMELSHIVQIVGIWGMGGIGKTTLASTIFDQFYVKFDGSCFMENVRSKIEKGCGIENLQNKMLSTILQEKIKLQGHNIPEFTKERVRCMKVFIVLDDVTEVEQLEKLIRGLDQYGPGTRIIVTTRDKRILENFEVCNTNIYEVGVLNNNEAFDLFCNYAFKENNCPKDLKVHSQRLVEYVNGNPLALKVLGSTLHKKNKAYWDNALEKLKEICSYEIDHIYGVLKSSFNELMFKEKSIFLDIACLLVGMNKDFVIKILEDFMSSGLNVLIDKSLITISDYDQVQIHDLLQEMGREIVRKEFINEPGKRSRLWYYKDVRRVLKKNEGSEKIEGIFLNVDQIKDIHLAPGVFRNMPNLRLLQISKSVNSFPPSLFKLRFDQGLEYLPKELRYLHWLQYPLKTLPSNFNPKNLIELHLPHSHLEQLWKGKKTAFKLKSIYLNNPNNLVGTPDLSKASNLESKRPSDCRTLACVPSSIQNFNHLSYLNLSYCQSLRAFSSNIHFVSPVTVAFTRCVNLAEFPQISGKVIRLYLSNTAIEEVPSSIECLADLKVLHLIECMKLKRLSTSICKLKSLLQLLLDGCINLESFPEILEKMEYLEFIALTCTAITELPSSVENLEGLEQLSLGGCSNLQYLPDNIGYLKSLKYIYARGSSISQLPSSVLDSKVLEELDFSACNRLLSLPSLSSGSSSLVRLSLSDCHLMEIPQDIGFLSSLEDLNLTSNDFVSLPTSIKKLSRLERLFLSKCHMLQSLPELPLFLLDLNASNCSALRSLPELPLYLQHLDASNCYELRSLPELPLYLKHLDASNCYELRSLPEILLCREELETSILERLSMENAPRHSWGIDCNFTNCMKLNEEAHNKILADLQLRIQQIAMAALRLSTYENSDGIPAIEANILLPGSEIPGWFKNRSSGSSITIQLPQHSCSRKLIGMAFSAVFESKADSIAAPYSLIVSSEYEVKTLSNSVHGRLRDMHTESFCSDHVLVGLKPIRNVELPDANHRTTVSFELSTHKSLGNKYKVKCCGVCPVFANPNTSTLKFVGMSGTSASVGSFDEEGLEPSPKRICR